MSPAISTREKDSRMSSVSERFLAARLAGHHSHGKATRRLRDLQSPTRWVRSSLSCVAIFLGVVTLAAVVGCKPDGKASSALASRQLGELAKAAAEDVRELRAGM